MLLVTSRALQGAAAAFLFPATLLDRPNAGDSTSPEPCWSRRGRYRSCSPWSRLALKDVRLALQEVDGDRFAALACLADEWQQIVDRGLGGQDLTVVTRGLEQELTTPR